MKVACRVCLKQLASIFVIIRNTHDTLWPCHTVEYEKYLMNFHTQLSRFSHTQQCDRVITNALWYDLEHTLAYNTSIDVHLF